MDEQLAAPAEVVPSMATSTHNQLWDAHELRLPLVADFDTTGVAKPEYDLGVISGLGPASVFSPQPATSTRR